MVRGILTCPKGIGASCVFSAKGFCKLRVEDKGLGVVLGITSSLASAFRCSLLWGYVLSGVSERRQDIT